ncbi:MAG TPA: hypothetical protein VFG19_14260 [Geobacteraceae bacterium]|nr:hypothetical protein [Geobacteraceae bacterium]
MMNEELAMKTWIDGNLGVTTETLSRSVAWRWQRLLMRDEKLFYRLALYGFVKHRRRERGDNCYPEAEFTFFCGEFINKLRLVLKGSGAVTPMPMFERVGLRTFEASQRPVNQRR